MSGRGVGGTPSRPLDTHSVAGRRVRRRPRAPHVLALGCPHRTHLRGPAAPLPVVRGFDDHHRVRHPSRSRPFHPQLSRFPHPTPATLSGSRSTPGHVHVRSNRRVRPHRSGAYSGPRFARCPRVRSVDARLRPARQTTYPPSPTRGRGRTVSPAHPRIRSSRPCMAGRRAFILA